MLHSSIEAFLNLSKALVIHIPTHCTSQSYVRDPLELLQDKQRLSISSVALSIYISLSGVY